MKLEIVCVMGMGISASFYLTGQFNHLYPLSLQIYSQNDIEMNDIIKDGVFFSL